MLELPLGKRNPLKAIVKRALEQEKFRSLPSDAVAPPGAKFHVEEVGHEALVRCGARADKQRMIAPFR